MISVQGHGQSGQRRDPRLNTNENDNQFTNLGEAGPAAAAQGSRAIK
jgi:hypothetical protein